MKRANHRSALVRSLEKRTAWQQAMKQQAGLVASEEKSSSPQAEEAQGEEGASQAGSGGPEPTV